MPQLGVGAHISWLKPLKQNESLPTSLVPRCGKAARARSSGNQPLARRARPIWSRSYQIGTDRSIFGDRDKTIHNDVNELSRERRNGYAWFNSAGNSVLAQFKSWARLHAE